MLQDVWSVPNHFWTLYIKGLKVALTELDKISELRYTYKRYYFTLKNFMAPFLWMGFNCLKATATSRRQFTFYHSVPRNSW